MYLGFESAWIPPPLWCGVVRGLGLLSVPPPPLWCGVVRGSGRPECFDIIIIIIIIMMFLPWVHCHRKRAPQEGRLVTVGFSIPSWESPGSKVSVVTRIGCVWDEILVAVDGLGAAVREKYTQSQGFGIFGPGRADAMVGGGGIPWGGGGAGAPRSYMSPRKHVF